MLSNPLRRRDELPREFHFSFNRYGVLQADVIDFDANGIGLKRRAPCGPEGFRVEYTDASGKRWRISAEPIATEPVDERTLGEQGAEPEREVLGRSGEQPIDWPELRITDSERYLCCGRRGPHGH